MMDQHSKHTESVRLSDKLFLPSSPHDVFTSESVKGEHTSHVDAQKMQTQHMPELRGRTCAACSVWRYANWFTESSSTTCVLSTHRTRYDLLPHEKTIEHKIFSERNVCFGCRTMQEILQGKNGRPVEAMTSPEGYHDQYGCFDIVSGRGPFSLLMVNKRQQNGSVVHQSKISHDVDRSPRDAPRYKRDIVIASSLPEGGALCGKPYKADLRLGSHSIYYCGFTDGAAMPLSSIFSSSSSPSCG